MEKRILASCLKDRAAYEEIFSRIQPDSFSPLGQLVGELIQGYYDADKEAKHADKETLIERVKAKLTSDKQIKAVTEYLESLDPEISVPNLFYDIKMFKQQKLGDELSVELANRGDSKNILDLMTKYQELETANPEDEEQVYEAISVEKLAREKFSPDELIKLFPKDLNDRCDGGARPGHHILVYARPEMGKTLFLLNMAAGFLLQGMRVLYIGNEDPASDIIIRLIGRLSRMTRAQVLEDPKRAEEEAWKKGYDKFVLASLSPGNFFEIRKLVERYKPDALIIDQLRNIEVKAENRTSQLEKAATMARNTGKKYNLVVVSATQAGESAEGKAILGRDDIDYSKTGIQAQADLMVGIGADETMERHGLRTLNLPKNKLSGKHEHFTVQINASLGTVESTST